MLYISHRGNISGPNPAKENCPYHIMELLTNGISCEVDVRYDGTNFWLGHDFAQHVVTSGFFSYKDLLWCHAKNLAALDKLLDMGLNCFWHENDQYTLTSQGFIWAYPDQLVNKNTVIVDLSERWMDKKYDCFGVCGDFMK